MSGGHFVAPGSAAAWALRSSRSVARSLRRCMQAEARTVNYESLRVKKTANVRMQFFRCTKRVLTLHLLRDVIGTECEVGQAWGTVSTSRIRLAKTSEPHPQTSHGC